MSDATEEDEKFGLDKEKEPVINCKSYPLRVLAGAGTGKTTTMVEKIRTLIEEEDVPPEEILALTFTNQATESTRSKLEKTIGDSANDIDAYTYHAIGREIISEFGYYGSFDPRAELVDDVGQTKLIYDSVEDVRYDFMETRVKPPTSTTHNGGVEKRLESFITKMKSEGITPEEVDDYLPDKFVLDELSELPDKIEKDAEELFPKRKTPTSPEQLQKVVTKVRVFIDRLETYNEQLGETSVEKNVAAFLEVFVNICESIIETFESKADVIVDGEYDVFGRVPAYLFNVYSNGATGVEEISQNPLDRLSSYITEIQATHDLITGYESYEAALAESDYFDLDDLIIQSEQLLATEPSVQEWVEDRWSYVFCDEFQDTDAIQFDLIRQIAKEANLFVVGDDDQSIYEWRGANTSNITDDFREAYPEFENFELEKNYRSREPILKLADNAIEHLGGRESSKILKATEERKGVRSGVAFFDEDDAESEAERIADSISKLRAGNAPGVSEQFRVGDMAILVRRDKHARPIQTALKQRGIPYNLVGGVTTASTGVNTIIAYLRTLVNHDDEVSLNRVLTMCYHLPESDLAKLNREESLWKALHTCDPNVFTDPVTVSRAQKDLQYFDRAARTISISSLCEQIKQRTQLDLFLTEQERRELRYLDSLIEGFNSSPIETELDEAFIEYLRYAATNTIKGSRTGDPSERSDEVVTIMTIHKAKGIDFPVVFLPRLEASEWSQSNSKFQNGKSRLTLERPETVDFVRREREEQRRIFHVGITRAEDLLVLSSTGQDDGESETIVSIEELDSLYPDTVEWQNVPKKFDIWSLVTESLPETAVDWTNQDWNTHDLRPVLQSEDDEYDINEANTRLAEIATQTLASEFDLTKNGSNKISQEPSQSVEPRIRQEFSYTSIDKYNKCPRQYYLDHVVEAYEDSILERPKSHSQTNTESSVSRRLVGQLFHQTAKEVATREHASQSDWRKIAERQSQAVPAADNDTLEEVYDCIENYFDSPVSDWTLIEAEYRFEIELPTTRPLNAVDLEEPFSVVGAIDAIYEDTSGEYVVVDYKTGLRESDYSLQCIIYLIAANQLFEGGFEANTGSASGIQHSKTESRSSDLTISKTVILELGPDGPELNRINFIRTELEMYEQSIVENLREVKLATYEDKDPDYYCENCPHNSLPCFSDD